MTEKPGDWIGRYRLLQEIGHGGCGVVYMAEQEEPVRRKVALKVIKLGMDTKQVVARFEAERQALALMDHPNIAKIYDAGMTEAPVAAGILPAVEPGFQPGGRSVRNSGRLEKSEAIADSAASPGGRMPPSTAGKMPAATVSAGRPYFVMELVGGVKITDYCEQNNLTTRQRLDLFVQVCRAIQHAHQKGIIHRDIKPSNVLVATHDGVPVPKVIDFGIAKATQGRLTDQTLFTAFEQFIGTPAYMSPEQAQLGGLDVDTRSDIYSLGVLLYELLTSKTPFDAKELLGAGIDTMRRTILEKEPPKPSTRLTQDLGVTRPTTTPSTLNPHRLKELIHLVRGDLDWIVMKCLEKERARRYETANGLASDVERHLHNEPVIASPPSNVYRFQKLVRRNKGLVSAGTAVVAVLVLGMVVSIWQAVRAEREGRLAKSEGERARIAAETLRQNLYVADVGLSFQAWESGNASRARVLLEQQRPMSGQTDLRSFEWRYLHGITRSQELFTLQSKSLEIWGSAISPDGRMFAAGGEDGKVLLWDLQTRQEVASLTCGSGIVYSLAFSPDGQTLVTPSNDGMTPIHVWNVQTHQVKGLLRGHSKGVPSVAFSPDGQSLASVAGWAYATNDPGEIFIWDVASMKQRAQLVGHRSSVGYVAFSPDGSTLASPMGDGTILLWDIHSRQVIRSMGSHHGLVISVAFSPDGKLIASGGKDGTVRLWNQAKGQMTTVLGEHAGPVFSVAFAPDGKRLASGSLDHTAKLWDVEEAREVTTLKGHSGRVFSVSFSRDGQQMATGSLDGTAKVWPVPRRGKSVVFDRHRGVYASVAFSPDGRWLIRNAADEVTLWTAATQAKVATIPASGSAFSPDSKLLACVREASGEIWSMVGTEPKLVRTIPARIKLKLNEQPCWSPDGRLLAVRNQSNSITLWRTDEWIEVTKIGVAAAPRDNIQNYMFSPDGKLFTTSSARGDIRLWDAGDWSTWRLFPVPKQDYLSLAFSPDGRWLATGGRDTVIRLWDVATGNVRQLHGEAGSVWCLAFSHDGKTLAVGSHDGAVKFWNVATCREIMTLKAHDTIVCGLAFSPDDKTFATICVDQTMRLWTAPSFVETDTAASPDGHSRLP